MADNMIRHDSSRPLEPVGMQEPLSALVIRSPFAPVALAAAAGLGAALVLYREGRMLGLDAYYYCEFAKVYASSLPTAFGNHWPCGYPLLGGLLGRLGVPAYESLSAVSLVSLLGILLISGRLLIGTNHRCALLVALAVIPVVGVQLLGAMSELPFALAWLVLLAALAKGERAACWWLAAGAAVACLALRYAGGLALVTLWLWMLAQRRPLRKTTGLLPPVAAAVTATIAAAGLLFWNWQATGYVSGAPRESPLLAGRPDWLFHLADLGWSPVFALGLGGLRDRLAAHPAAATIIGGLLSLGTIALGLHGWLHPRRSWARVFSLGLITYWLGMATLRSVSSFDELHNGRTVLPVVAPLLLLFVVQTPRWGRSLIAAVSALVILAGTIASARGLSREIGGDVRPAVHRLDGRLEPGDAVGINDQALSLSAYVRNRVVRLAPVPPDEPAPPCRFIVLAGAPQDRAGCASPVEAEWRRAADALVARGSHQWLLQTPTLFVLERQELR